MRYVEKFFYFASHSTFEKCRVDFVPFGVAAAAPEAVLLETKWSIGELYMLNFQDCKD